MNTASSIESEPLATRDSRLATPARDSRLATTTRCLLALAALLVGVRVPSAALAHRAGGSAVPRRASGCTSGPTRSPGSSPQDLHSLNGLNHYIGMKPIVPESIPELRFMPVDPRSCWRCLGLAVALSGRRRLLLAWTGLLRRRGPGGTRRLLALGIRLRPRPRSDGGDQGAGHVVSTAAPRYQAAPQLSGDFLAGGRRVGPDRSRSPSRSGSA